MSKFMFVVRGGPIMPQRLSPDELQSHLRKWSDWVGTLAKEGCHIGGSPLENRGRTIHGAERTVFEGPQMGLKDVITGNVIVEAASLEAATEMAKACPVFDISGSVEVWPLPSEAVAAPMARANAAE
jgi:hypothetical protein